MGNKAHEYEVTRLILGNSMEKGFFEEKKSRVNRRLEDVLGKFLAMPYMIKSSGKRPNPRYGLK
jgi:hypothetical protein